MTTTRDQLIEKVRPIVGRNPARTNGMSCSYTERRNGEVVPSCGVGVVLHEGFGVPITTLQHWDAEPPLSDSTITNLFNEDWVPVDFDEVAQEFLIDFQNQADKGFSWGAAFDHAVDYTASL